ncbi:hypothetical protein JCM10207_005484 [Rhodosporidiobolus poonsookiae]
MVAPFTRPWGDSITGTPLQVITMTGCAAGFFVFGFDQGIANALTGNADFFVQFPRIHNDETVLGVVLALFVLGAFVGCLTASFIGNAVGRRPFLQVATVGTIIGAAGMAGAVNLGMFCAFRLINGFSVGILTSIVPSYVAEISKPRVRGLMMSLELLFAATGLMTAFWVAYGFAKEQGPIGWRVPTALQGIFILITLVTLQFTPESPRWLAERGRVEEGRRVLERLHGTDYANAAITEIQEAIAIEHQAAAGKGYMDCFAKNDQCFRYRTGLSLLVNFFQQATGINMATYYSGAILINSVKMEPSKATLVLGFLGVAGWFFMLGGCFYLMERVGRVNTMVIGAIGCCIGQTLLAAGVAVDTKAGGIVAATGLYLFLCIFSGTHLPTAFVYSAEIVPLAIRSRAATLGVATQYIFNFLVVMVTPIAIKNIGYKFYIIFAVVNALMVPAAFFLCPETAGLSLEGIDQLFEGGKVRIRRGVKGDLGGHLSAAELGKDKGSFEHMEKVDSDKLAL